MELFSRRKGITSVKTTLQIDSIDNALRIGLWNVLLMTFIVRLGRLSRDLTPNDFDTYTQIINQLWHIFFKEPLDSIPRKWSDVRTYIRKTFFSYKWFEVYDFLEFIAGGFNDIDPNLTYNFVEGCNATLEREQSGYRFAGLQLVQITTSEEINEIDEALAAPKSMKAISTHLETSLRHLSDRKKPDYRNSIKESISAVEAMCRLMTGDTKATLSEALKKLEQPIHPALKSAFDRLYGYTSDKEGIRHSLLEESDLDFEEAKFMLVACSAFVNYMKAKGGLPTP